MDESAVHRQLRAMQDKGYIQFQRYKQRSIKLKVEKI
jgi:predicted transcriptional regulator